MTNQKPRLGRRGFLAGGAAVGAGVVLSACTGNNNDQNTTIASNPTGKNLQPGKAVTIGFAAPAADHGWIAAITTNAKAQAEAFPDVTLNAVAGSNDPNTQIQQMDTLISDGVDAIVILPFDGKALTESGLKAMEAGIPVVNLDRIFDTPLAYRTWIGGDNYGMGVSAGNYIASQLQGVNNPVICEIAGLDSLPLTQERSQGFKDALAANNLQLSTRVAAEFTVESGEEVTAQLLQAEPKIDAIWNHDDDQGLGVMAAIEGAGRDEFILVGGAGSRDMMELIQSGDSVVKATVTYSPSMASSAIVLARLIAQGKGMSDLAELQVPSMITLTSETITADNVEQYLELGFDS